MSSFSIEAGAENVDDGHEILQEFLLVGSLLILVVNQEFSLVFVTYPLEEVECNSAQSVSVGYHNLCDISTHDLLKNPFEAFPFEVDPGSCVRKYLKPFVGCLKIGDLSLEVFVLLCGGDSAVDDVDPFFLLFLFGLEVLAELLVSFKLGDVVEPVPSVDPETLDCVIIVPSSEGVCMDSENSCCSCRCDEFIRSHLNYI